MQKQKRVANFTDLHCTNTNTATMAKRKTKADPEELPDAPDKGKKQDDDDSGSDEVCDSNSSPQCASSQS